MANVHANVITAELGTHLRKHVAACLRLLDEGATIPFIARYRKEATGGMDEVTVHAVQKRHQELSELDKRKEYILDVIRERGALTAELEERINETLDPVALEDIYLPYKPKRNTRAQAARALGLEPLAKIIMAQNSTDVEKQAKKFAKEAGSISAALAGASDIIAEWVSESEKARNLVRSRYQRSAVINSKVIAGKEDEGKNYQNYFNFSEPLRTCNSHRYLAMRRGEEEEILKVSITIDDDEMIDRLSRMFVRSGASEECASLVRGAVKDGYRRLMRPSIENEVAAATKEKSDDAAIQMFADNVRQLLMAAPLGRKRVLAIDPGFRTGCKLVVLDEQGNLIQHDVIYPTPPANDFVGAADALCFYVDRYRIDAIAIGNGTAGRETERFIRDVMLPRKVQLFMVNENGASVYSASEVAREEFPNEDVTVRGAVSIGRRLIDPLAELVKIDPKAIGVGQYQHAVNQTKLKDSLDYVVESCVNTVGVNVNTASRQLLSYVSGIGPSLAANIVKYRAENGDFTSRDQLLQVPRMGEKAFQQCAGFLRIPGAPNPLDNTGVHPERYELVEQIAFDAKADVARLARDRNLLHSIELDRYVTKEVGLPTLTDIILELEKPGRDPRETVEETPYDDSVRTIDDLHIGQELTGKVNNITAFGVFVDLGMKENGLIHISQLSERFISSPSEVVSIGQNVRVRVMDIDTSRGRIALTMKGVAQ
ncbi:Tex family protein [Duncaniella muris]|uniref:Tex family protein n=3 Tax=Duncaniella muris TaxID=2094150 RepID=UPI00136DBFC3|nr:Tex family protein [Duncaniella muris]NBH92240.1 RNA-binding transcriptional accessory protein [Muribaculaceae bacterium S4]NBI20697.1 RNA-binding transcriptional accessory protein [Muribaculaceae bacterium Z1]